MRLDSQWIFSDGQAMPNAARAGCSGAGGYSGYIDWTANFWKDFINTPQPLWLITTINTVSATGTSLQMEFWQHSTTTLTSGTKLGSGQNVVIADMSTDPYDEGHVLWEIPLMSLLCNIAANGKAGKTITRQRYCGLVMSATGNCSDGKIDSWLHIGVNPPVYVPVPTASNIVMPA